MRSTNEAGLQAGDSDEGDSERLLNGSGSLEIPGIITGMQVMIRLYSHTCTM